MRIGGRRGGRSSERKGSEKASGESEGRGRRSNQGHEHAIRKREEREQIENEKKKIIVTQTVAIRELQNN